jgi:myo-inositol-1(or 4)-monophosphatase
LNETNVNVEQAVQVAAAAAREAGAVLLEELKRPLQIDYKGEVDLVTQADIRSERLVTGRLREAFPGHAIVGEELGEQKAREGEARYRWYVDPLDGTINFVQSHPMFAVSLALEHRGELVLGVIHAPLLGETFTAQAGQGAALDGRPIHVSRTRRLDQAVVATGFPYGRAEVAQNNVDNFARIVLQVRGIRRGGSAALDLAYVAAGRFDAFWELHLESWDMAAGACLVREAGGRVTDFAGGDDWLPGRNIVATNGPLHDEIRRNLTPLE